MWETQKIKKKMEWGGKNVYKNDGNNFELRKKLYEKKLHNLCRVQYSSDRDRDTDIVCTPEQQTAASPKSVR